MSHKSTLKSSINTWVIHQHLSHQSTLELSIDLVIIKYFNFSLPSLQLLRLFVLLQFYKSYVFLKHSPPTRLYIYRLSLLIPLVFAMMSVYFHDNLRDYLICSSREEQLRFNLYNFWKSKDYPESLTNLSWYHPYEIALKLIGLSRFPTFYDLIHIIQVFFSHFSALPLLCCTSGIFKDTNLPKKTE